MNLFNSATIRMTLWYLAIIMTISIVFSAVLYQVSTREFNRQIVIGTPPTAAFFLPNGFNEFQSLRLATIDESRNNLKANLVVFNLIIFVAGGLLSYILARRTLQPIEQAVQAQNQFIADASHELRTPLTAIKTELEVALRDKDLTIKESRSLHESTLEEVERLKNLTNGLLRLARVEDKTLKESLGECNVEEIVKEAVLKVDSLAEQKEISIEAELQDAWAHGDKENLIELLIIILDNAIKYSPSNSRIKISVQPRRIQKIVAIKIKDEGFGIRQSDLPHIFNRFYRADSSRSKQNIFGYGLGLSIAKKIVEAHNGKIEVRSKAGSGTTFTISIPLAR